MWRFHNALKILDFKDKEKSIESTKTRQLETPEKPKSHKRKGIQSKRMIPLVINNVQSQ